MVDKSGLRHVAPWMIHVKDWSRRLRLVHVARFGSFMAVVVTLTWLMTWSGGNIPENLREGAIAPYDVRADREYRLVDEGATNAARTEALKGVLPVFDFYTGKGSEIADRIRAAFETVRQRVGAKVPTDLAELTALRATWEEAAELKLTDTQWAALVAEKWSFGNQEFIVGQILRVMSRPLVADTETLSAYQERGITVRRMPTLDATAPSVELSWRGKTLTDVLSVEGGRKAIRKRTNNERVQRGNTEELANIAAQAMQPNCGPNVLESEMRRATALKGIPDRQRLVQAGEILVRRGEPYTHDHLFLLEGIRALRASGAFPLKFLGTGLCVALLLLLVHWFGKTFIRKYAPQRHDLIFLGIYLVCMVAMLRAGALVSEVLADDIRLPIPRFAYAYLMPLAAGGMLVRFLLNSETALLFSVVLAVLTGIIFPQDPSYTAYGLIAGIAGAATIAHADKRSAIIRAGISTGLIMIVAVLAIQLMRIGALTELPTLSNLCWDMGLAFTGALFSAIFVLTATPLAETVFGYTTDIKLLELANLNHPLLRELIIRAPGTYHHSHLVGILAETGAQAINANPLLARVSAYYHDIGKIRKPLYFAENIKDSESRHERLTPHMSALIISSHIKEGVELAHTYKLPEKITAMIPQHHGTNRIGYFYERAKEHADPALGPIEEKDYRYPGPKPQSREAGILMLADQTEGAVRALKEKTAARIQQTVEAIINKSFAEGQLEECELTLKNLNEIGKAFARILLGIYHQRIEYPRETLKLHEKDVQVIEDGAVREPAVGPSGVKPSTATHH